ncbi:LytTR family transcriptional regulator DNA-binding domain-containing protein [Paenibacillus sp. Marseille-Q4541]|uniref:LytR/AlgR family response regulator transcription factor n=1 Tax=Paenibacillus sp. Marseille-Q4541 TaxID=2831522 RepID=UPI001BAB7FC7|nr:LytTR family transcriptional regulator DNA-binding domain-containing protein [Paenibacillus sp. Marseille-Q4541]
MLKAFVVDDEPLARDELIYILKRSRKVDVIGEADCMRDALQAIATEEPDVVFLDIELAEDSGLQLARNLMELTKPPIVVFATAFDEYALQAFDLDALDYILKPFDDRRILQTLEKIGRFQQEGAVPPGLLPSRLPATGKIAITTDDRIAMVDTAQIVFLSTDEGKTLIKTTDKEYRTAEPLARLEGKLSSSSFIRVHRAFMVNAHQIAEVQPWFNSTYYMIMSDGSKVPVSRTYVKELKLVLGF